MNVYNIIWADDEIDDILDEEFENDLKEMGFFVQTAHNGLELEDKLSKPENKDAIDAIIVDANFNETSSPVESERATSGLDYARSLYVHKLNRSIPMFLYTGRSDELLKDVYKSNEAFLKDFPRGTRWFNKLIQADQEKMFQTIKETVDNHKSTSFIIRNQFREELNAATLIGGARDFLFEFLVNEHDNTLSTMVEPFVRVRRILEKMFTHCESYALMPPVSDDMNGAAYYFLRHKYSKQTSDNKYIPIYKMLDETLMPMPIAQSLSYIVSVVQDGAHSKKQLKLKVDKYFKQTEDVLLLKSVCFLLMDCIKWFALTIISHQDIEINKAILWEPIKKQDLSNSGEQVSDNFATESI